MKFLDTIVSKLGWDKVGHFAISGWLTLIMMIFLGGIIGPATIVLGIGILKEVLDKVIKKTEFSLADLIADILGILVSCVVVFVALGRIKWL